MGYERVYVRVNPEGATSSAENPFGVPVECNEVLEEPGDVERRTPSRRRKVAYVPVADPTSVTITRCGEYFVFDGVTALSGTDCVASREVAFTPDSHVVVECEEEATYPVGSGEFLQGGVAVRGHEQVYIRVDPEDASRPAENPLGIPVVCDEVLEKPKDPEVYTYHSLYRWKVAYLPVADPTSVTITRCGEYEIDYYGVSTQSDDCVASREVAFTPDFDLYVECEMERTRSADNRVRTTGYKRIYYRVD